MLTVKRVEEIAEELRITRCKDTGKIAFKHIYKKYKNEFKSEAQFLKLMRICALFWASRGENTERDRNNTIYIYV